MRLAFEILLFLCIPAAYWVGVLRNRAAARAELAAIEAELYQKLEKFELYNANKIREFWSKLRDRLHKIF
jgi:hypothetical protein